MLLRHEPGPSLCRSPTRRNSWRPESTKRMPPTSTLNDPRCMTCCARRPEIHRRQCWDNRSPEGVDWGEGKHRLLWSRIDTGWLNTTTCRTLGFPRPRPPNWAWTSCGKDASHGRTCCPLAVWQRPSPRPH